MPLVTYSPIGVIHTPFREVVGMPIQAVAATGVPGWVELDPAYEAGLEDVDGFSHLLLVYHLHRVQGVNLIVTPFLDDQAHGIFATRSPKRPNPIGISVVRLVRVERCSLHIEDVDMVDGTPLLDLKPYVPAFDARAADRIGWFAKNINQVSAVRADDRFL